MIFLITISHAGKHNANECFFGTTRITAQSRSCVLQAAAEIRVAIWNAGLNTWHFHLTVAEKRLFHGTARLSSDKLYPHSPFVCSTIQTPAYYVNRKSFRWCTLHTSLFGFIRYTKWFIFLALIMPSRSKKKITDPDTVLFVIWIIMYLIELLKQV